MEEVLEALAPGQTTLQVRVEMDEEAQHVYDVR